jgi:hypothetical protein
VSAQVHFCHVQSTKPNSSVLFHSIITMYRELESNHSNFASIQAASCNVHACLELLLLLIYDPQNNFSPLVVIIPAAKRKLFFG